MTLFKLIFEHDMVLEPVGTVKSKHESSTLEDFLKPKQTYSRFYFSATDLELQKFGLSASEDYKEMLLAFTSALGPSTYTLFDRTETHDIEIAISSVPEGGAIVITPEKVLLKGAPFPVLKPSETFREQITELTERLDSGHLVLFVVKAHHGFDLHLFAKKNIYRDFFYAFKPIIREDFRFFSINGKRAKSERLFYFETWSLERLPHGFEEVKEDTAFY
jgi:hypothetical protein